MRNGQDTKSRILKVAEELFSAQGIDGTSMKEIAQGAQVNKALIYYYFESKDYLVRSLIEKMMQEIEESFQQSRGQAEPEPERLSLEAKIRHKVSYVAKWKRILNVIFMESLKGDGRGDTLLQCADMVLRHEHPRRFSDTAAASEEDLHTRRREQVHEFFTGFIPIVAFVLFEERWCRHYACDKDQLLEDFVESFSRSHLASHGGSQPNSDERYDS